MNKFMARLVAYFEQPFEYFKHTDTHFFTYTYIKIIQTALLKLLYLEKV